MSDFHPDPDDGDLLVLALAIRFPLWSYDDAFERTRVKQYTTAPLLRATGMP